MKKFTSLFISLIFVFFLSTSAKAVSSGETSGLGTLSLEIEYTRTFQSPASQMVLGKIIHGLSNQVDLKLMLGNFGIEANSGFVYGVGIKWGLLQETHFRPAVSLNLEYLRGSYSANLVPNSTANIKVESSFFAPSILISKNLIWITPFLEAGYDFADIKARNISTGKIYSELQGSSNTWFLGAGAVFEFDILLFGLEAIYEFDTPLGESALKAKAGFNLLL